MRALRWALASLVLAGCGGGEQPSTTGGADGGAGGPPKPLHVTAQEVSWNPEMEPVGTVAAVADEGASLVVFSDKGAITFDHGVVASTDSSQTAWRAASVIPAADHTGQWMVGVAMDGQVYRAHPEFPLESISGRYELQDSAILSCAPAGADGTVFGLEGKVAVADGMTVRQYDTGPFTSLAGTDGRVAMVGKDAVMLLDTKAQTMTTFDLPGVMNVAFDGTGTLFAATARRIYQAADGDTLTLYHELPDEAGAFHGLVSSGERVWAVSGGELGVLDSGTVALTVGLGLPESTQIVGTPSGDVWALNEGALRRFAATAIEVDGKALWEEQIGPIVTASCQACHSPGGPAAVFDLTTYEAWVSRRAAINQRVVVEQNMPPPGSAPLSDADRQKIADWVQSGF